MIENEIISKGDLSILLRSVEVPVSEGISGEEDKNRFPRIVYWPFTEQDIVASGKGYKNYVTYQVSLYDRIPQNVTYKKLRKVLREKGIHPVFNHEYVEKDPIYEKTWHTYFAVDVLEDILEEE